MGARPDAPGAAVPRPRAADPVARVPFRADEPAHGHSCGCRRLVNGRPCDRQAQTWHHWLPQRDIRVYARGRTRGLPAREARQLLRVLLADARNLTPIAFECHMLAEQTTHGRFLRHEVPPGAWEFAGELHLTAMLARRYPVAASGPVGEGGLPVPQEAP